MAQILANQRSFNQDSWLSSDVHPDVSIQDSIIKILFFQTTTLAFSTWCFWTIVFRHAPHRLNWILSNILRFMFVCQPFRPIYQSGNFIFKFWLVIILMIILIDIKHSTQRKIFGQFLSCLFRITSQFARWSVTLLLEIVVYSFHSMVDTLIGVWVFPPDEVSVSDQSRYIPSSDQYQSVNGSHPVTFWLNVHHGLASTNPWPIHDLNMYGILSFQMMWNYFRVVTLLFE